MGENIYSWSKSASSNATADTSINWAENMLPSGVNNSARGMMATLAKFRDDNNGTLTSTGSSNAYLLTANTAYTALATGLTVTFKANFANTSAATLVLTPNGGAAFASKAIRAPGDIALSPSQIPSGHQVILHYDATANSSAGAWMLLNPAQATTTSSRPLNILAFGGIAGGGSATAAAQAAYDAAVEGEEIHIPAGAWTFSTAVVPTSKTVTWILEDGCTMSTASSQNLLVGYETLSRVSGFPVHRMDAMRARSNGQETGHFYTLTIPANTGTVDHEKEALFALAVTYDDELATGPSVYKAAVGGTLRGYIGATNQHGRAFGANLYALIEDGGQGVLCGCEIDVSHNSHENATPFSGDVKIGLNVANVGAVACTTAIEVSGNPWWYGLVIAQASIKNDADARAIYVQNVFSVDRDGHTTVGKTSQDRQVAGVELVNSGQVWQSTTGGAATLIHTVTGTPGAGTISQIVAQQKNSSGTVISFANQFVSASVATAGSETTVWGIDGYLAGAGVRLIQVSGSVIGPGTDNVVTCGNPSLRYSTVYAGTGAINTSDATEKDWLGEPDPRVFDAILSIPLGVYQFKDSVAKKGKDSARLHFGATAQGLRDAFEKHGLDASRYGLFCADEIEDGKVRLGIRYDQFELLRTEAIRRKLVGV